MTTGLNDNIKGYISAASKMYPNVSVSFLTTMAAYETAGTFNTDAVSPTGCLGLFQFSKSTAAAYNLSDPTDPEASTFAAAKLAQDNYNSLAQRIGDEIPDAVLYLAHQEGASGAAWLIENPDTPITDAPPKIYSNLLHNNAKDDMTAQDFIDATFDKYTQLQSKYGTAEGDSASSGDSQEQFNLTDIPPSMLALALQQNPYGSLQDRQSLIASLAAQSDGTSAGGQPTDVPLPPPRPNFEQMAQAAETGSQPLQLPGAILAEEAASGQDVAVPVLQTDLPPLYYSDGSYGLASVGPAVTALNLYTHTGMQSERVTQDSNGQMTDQTFDQDGMIELTRVVSNVGQTLQTATGDVLTLANTKSV